MIKPNRPNDESPIGALPDGTLNIVEPGTPAHKPRILGPDGAEYSPEDFDENGELIGRRV